MLTFSRRIPLQGIPEGIRIALLFTQKRKIGFCLNIFLEETKFQMDNIYLNILKTIQKLNIKLRDGN